MNSQVYHRTDADGIVLVPHDHIKYYTNIHQVIYELDATTLHDFIFYIGSTFDKLDRAKDLYSEKYKCEGLWNDRIFDLAFGSYMHRIFPRRHKDHEDHDKYFKDSEKYEKFVIKLDTFQVMDEDVMHELYKNHKKLFGITKVRGEIDGLRADITPILLEAYNVSTNAARKYKSILVKLNEMNITDLIKYDDQFLSLIDEMQNKPNNTFVYDPKEIFKDFKVLFKGAKLYIISNIYITNNKLYSTRIVNSLLVRHPFTDLTTYLKIPGDILCDRYNEDYFYMTWEQDAKCFMRNGKKLCPLNPELKNSVTEKDCIYSLHRNKFDVDLCSKDLMYSKYVQETSFKRLDSSVWYYYIHSDGYLRIKCDYKITTKHITATGVIMLDDNCRAWFEEDGQTNFFLLRSIDKKTDFAYYMISADHDAKYKEMLVKKNLFERIDSNW